MTYTPIRASPTCCGAAGWRNDSFSPLPLSDPFSLILPLDCHLPSDFTDHPFQRNLQLPVESETFGEILLRFSFAAQPQPHESALCPGLWPARFERNDATVIIKRSREVATFSSDRCTIEEGVSEVGPEGNGAVVITDSSGHITGPLPRCAAIAPGLGKVGSEFDGAGMIADCSREIAFAKPGDAAIVPRLGNLRVEFDGAVEISERAVRVAFAAPRDAAIAVGFGAAGSE
jgi:hypothetical protein